ncbi:MAG: hypothetical protein IJC51_00405 [Eggerthellaceae bacterium]|nr:hypothetical protein [Eggerthellaceae bacterium]
MKSIYILLMKSTTSLSRIVGFITSDKYTHVSLAFDEDLHPLYTSTRKNGEDMFPAGPCEEYLDRGFLARHPFTPCALYELKVSEEVYHKARKEALRFVEQSNDYGFNVMGLIFCQIGRPLKRKRKYFCSQLVSEILANSGALNLPREACLMKPSDYMCLPELSCRFEGTLGQLRSRLKPAAVELQMARA